VSLYKVVQNKGAPGVDGQSVETVLAHSKELLPRLRRQLLEGSYRPGDIRRVWIPKPGGGERGLGIPNVIDRWVQQAVLQVLEPIFEPTFHDSSHGFRRGRGAQTAIAQARKHLEAGHTTIVDIDLAKFLDWSSYYTLVHGVLGKSCGWLSNTRMRRPFCRPRETCKTESSPRFTRCMIVWRDTPRRRMASGIAT
jgi:Reverse transcriptase (RNA-dependent DNA polymerase)